MDDFGSIGRRVGSTDDEIRQLERLGLHNVAAWEESQRPILVTDEKFAEELLEDDDEEEEEDIPEADPYAWIDSHQKVYGDTQQEINKKIIKRTKIQAVIQVKYYMEKLRSIYEDVDYFEEIIRVALQSMDRMQNSDILEAFSEEIVGSMMSIFEDAVVWQYLDRALEYLIVHHEDITLNVAPPWVVRPNATDDLLFEVIEALYKKCCGIQFSMALFDRVMKMKGVRQTLKFQESGSHGASMRFQEDVDEMIETGEYETKPFESKFIGVLYSTDALFNFLIQESISTGFKNISLEAEHKKWFDTISPWIVECVDNLTLCRRCLNPLILFVHSHPWRDRLDRNTPISKLRDINLSLIARPHVVNGAKTAREKFRLAIKPLFRGFDRSKLNAVIASDDPVETFGRDKAMKIMDEFRRLTLQYYEDEEFRILKPKSLFKSQWKTFVSGLKEPWSDVWQMKEPFSSSSPAVNQPTSRPVIGQSRANARKRRGRGKRRFQGRPPKVRPKPSAPAASSDAPQEVNGTTEEPAGRSEETQPISDMEEDQEGAARRIPHFADELPLRREHEEVKEQAKPSKSEKRAIRLQKQEETSASSKGETSSSTNKRKEKECEAFPVSVLPPIYFNTLCRLFGVTKGEVRWREVADLFVKGLKSYVVPIGGSQTLVRRIAVASSGKKSYLSARIDKPHPGTVVHYGIKRYVRRALKVLFMIDRTAVAQHNALLESAKGGSVEEE